MSGILEDQLESLLVDAKNDALIVEKIMESADWRSVVFKRQ